jgi:iron complex transport system ATP-binding protein
MIAYQALHVRYAGAEREALDGVDCSAAPGQLTAVVGPNGSGKSTMVRALLGRVPVTSGRVLADGADVRTLGREALARRVAVVGQREEPAFSMLVRDYIALGRAPWLRPWAPPSSDDRAAVERAVQLADVGALADRPTDTLSGGEWQRVRVARGLAQATPALVLDEPTTFLDIAHEMACFELLAGLARGGRAVLVVSHQLNLVARFADRVVLLSRGRVVAEGTPDDVMRGETLERVYEWPLVVARDPAVGAPTLVPLRKRPPTLP